MYLGKCIREMVIGHLLLANFPARPLKTQRCEELGLDFPVGQGSVYRRAPKERTTNAASGPGRLHGGGNTGVHSVKGRSQVQKLGLSVKVLSRAQSWQQALCLRPLTSGYQTDWVQVLVLPFTNSEMLHPSAPQFLHL